MLYHLNGLFKIVRVEIGRQMFAGVVGCQLDVVMLAQHLKNFRQWRVVEVEMSRLWSRDGRGLYDFCAIGGVGKHPCSVGGIGSNKQQKCERGGYSHLAPEWDDLYWRDIADCLSGVEFPRLIVTEYEFE